VEASPCVWHSCIPQRDRIANLSAGDWNRSPTSAPFLRISYVGGFAGHATRPWQCRLCSELQRGHHSIASFIKGRLLASAGERTGTACELKAGVSAPTERVGLDRNAFRSVAGGIEGLGQRLARSFFSPVFLRIASAHSQAQPDRLSHSVSSQARNDGCFSSTESGGKPGDPMHPLRRSVCSSHAALELPNSPSLAPRESPNGCAFAVCAANLFAVYTPDDTLTREFMV